MVLARFFNKIRHRCDNAIDVKGNNKKADYVVEVGEDRRGRAYAKERIDVRETV